MMSRIVNTFTGKQTEGIRVGGKEDLMVRFARCCNPIPGDDIIGFVTRGRGISVHRADCSNVKLFADDKERTIDVSWESSVQKKYLVSLEIVGGDRTGLLQEVSRVFVQYKVNIIDGSIKTTDKHARSAFTIEIAHKNQLKPIIRALQRIKDIENVSRVKEYIS